MEVPEEKKTTDYTGVIIAVVLLPVLLFFTHIGKTDIGLTVFLCLGVNLLTIRLYWKLRTRFWFWIIIVFVLALHVPLIIEVRWPKEWVPGIALLPLAVADFLIYVGAIWFVQKFIVKGVPVDDGA